MAGNTGDIGNTGNTGDTGNTGNSGSAGIAGEFGGGWFIEDRVDLPFVMELDSANAPLRFKRLSRSSFGDAPGPPGGGPASCCTISWPRIGAQTTDPTMTTEWSKIAPPPRIRRSPH